MSDNPDWFDRIMQLIREGDAEQHATNMRLYAQITRIVDLAELTGNQLTILANEVTGLANEVTTQGADARRLRADLMERMDRLDNRLSERRESDVVTHEIAQRVERRTKGTDDDIYSLSEQIGALQSQIHRLSSRVDQIEERKQD